MQTRNPLPSSAGKNDHPNLPEAISTEVVADSEIELLLEALAEAMETENRIVIP